jgi:hypothetical protein
MAKMVRLADGSYLAVGAIRSVRVGSIHAETLARGAAVRSHDFPRVVLTLTDGSELKFEAADPDEAQAEVDRIVGEIEGIGDPSGYLRATRPPVGWISPEQFAADQNPFLSTLRAYQGAYLAMGEQRGEPLALWLARRFEAMAAEVELTGAKSPEDHEDRREAMLTQAGVDAQLRLNKSLRGHGPGFD